jgi:acetone carboxylase gamma subunit
MSDVAPDRSKQEVSVEIVRRLEEGDLSWDEEFDLLDKERADPDRFEKYTEVLEEKVEFDDDILVRLNQYLYVVHAGEGERVVKCGQCGHDFGDYRVNWKIKADVNTRNTTEELTEIYSYEEVTPPADKAELREYICPGCATLLSVEVVPEGYPPIFEFLPDIDTFYSEVLEEPLPDADDEEWYQDRTPEVLAEWSD